MVQGDDRFDGLEVSYLAILVLPEHATDMAFF
jgi:hypothetical protein